MRSMLALFVAAPLLGAAPALAQQPLALPGMPAVPQGETLFVVDDVDSQRFFDDESVRGVPLKAREAVTVVTRHEGLVRVFVRGRFGWVAPAALTDELPPLPEEAGDGAPEGEGELPPLLPE